AYVRRLRGGGLRKNGRPKVVSEGPAWALVDGDSSLGMVSSEFAMQTALAKATARGIAFVGLRNNCHYGAAGYYASIAIEKDATAKPTAGPPVFSHAGSLTPLGGYKGYGIAFLIEVLSAILTGAAIRWQVSSWTFSDPSKPTGRGAAFIALHIASFMPVEQFKERIDRAIREIHAA